MKTSVDGGWGSWTGWSECNCNKERAMQRKCDSPPPAFGGATCFGLSQQTETCTPHGFAHCPGKCDLQRENSINIALLQLFYNITTLTLSATCYVNLSVESHVCCILK